MAAKVKRKQLGHIKYNARRDESDRFYGTAAWRKCRDAYIGRHPFCSEIEFHGRLVLAKVVDHIKPRKLHPELSLDETNLRSLCSTCHNRIGARVASCGL